MSDAQDRERFEKAYARIAPWDIGKPQAPFVQAAPEISGAVLDSGCGTGDLALFLAGRGCQVTGIDFIPEPLERARQKAKGSGSAARFLLKSALTLADWDERFDVVVDSGLFHVFQDADRAAYVAGLAHVLKPGGKLFLMCFSDQEPGSHGPRRLTREELQQAFREGWNLESIAPACFEIRADFTDAAFSPGGARAWFVKAVRRP
jgi:cyclopropane fatty-acyl-phospholipid synthase-like methyltransferase